MSGARSRIPKDSPPNWLRNNTNDVCETCSVSQMIYWVSETRQVRWANEEVWFYEEMTIWCWGPDKEWWRLVFWSGCAYSNPLATPDSSEPSGTENHQAAGASVWHSWWNSSPHDAQQTCLEPLVFLGHCSCIIHRPISTTVCFTWGTWSQQAS